MILKDGNQWEFPPGYLDALIETYQNCDVMAELRAMAAWLDANPGRRKTAVGMKRFITSWLQKADKGGGSPYANTAPNASKGIQTRDLTAEQDLTMNFTDDPEVEEYFLEKYGQCFTRDGGGVFVTRRRDRTRSQLRDETGIGEKADPEGTQGQGADPRSSTAQGHLFGPEGDGRGQ